MAATIIFDMDGTLIDSSDLIVNSINHVRHRLGLPPMDRQTILQAINDTTIHRPSFFYGVPEYSPHHLAWFRDYYTSHHKEQSRLYPGIKELLNQLALDHTLALATNAYRQSTQELLEHTGIGHYFRWVRCGDEVPNPKPHPQMLLEILHQSQTSKEDAVMVGDGKTDEEAAKRAGIPFVKVAWGWEEDGEGVQSVQELLERLQASTP
ncbi:MAG: haloacid dehalogenase [Nitratiruptor sp.]|nr:haloacid dehalogenase [Nitratiruptor sp.]NPA82933.1 HAD family hydrolase [Campylobacterota bacterium]